MLYDLSNPLTLQQFKARSEAMIRQGALVELTEKTIDAKKEIPEEERRTMRQHKTVWMWFGVFADYTGETSRQKAHDDVLEHLLGKRVIVSKITGEEYERDWHTSEMTKAELSAFMDKFKAFAMTEYNIYLPYYGDVGYEEMVKQYGFRQ